MNQMNHSSLFAASTTPGIFTDGLIEGRYKIESSDEKIFRIMDSETGLEFSRTGVENNPGVMLTDDDALVRAEAICDALNQASYKWVPDTEKVKNN